MNTETYIIICYSLITPILAIYSFIIGFNMSAGKKILARKAKKTELTEDEKMLERIDSAKVYDEVI